MIGRRRRVLLGRQQIVEIGLLGRAGLEKNHERIQRHGVVDRALIILRNCQMMDLSRNDSEFVDVYGCCNSVRRGRDHICCQRQNDEKVSPNHTS